MALGALPDEPRQRPVLRRVALVLLMIGALAGIGGLRDARPWVVVAGAVVLTLALVGLGDDALRMLTAARRRREAARLHRLLDGEATPCVTSDEGGRILYCNASAADRLGLARGGQVASALGGLFAHSGGVLYRLQTRAAVDGQAAEDVVTRRGYMRITVQPVGAGHSLWRFEEFGDRGGLGRGGDGISLPMLIAGRGGVVLFANEALRRLLGARPRALDRVFVQPPRHSGALATISGEKGPVQATVVMVDGPVDRREYYLLPASVAPPPPAATGIEELPIALLQLTNNGGIMAANRAARDLLRLTDAAMPHAAELFAGLGRPVRDWIADVAAGRLPGKAEVVHLNRPGPETYVQVALHPLPQGGVLAVVSDATALKTLEAQFVQSQKMQAIGQLAGGIAHDFNNLLTAIAGHCDLLLMRHDPGDPDYADLAQIHQNANRAAALVGQLLAFSRKQTLQAERLHLDEVLGDVTHLLKRLVGERVRLELALDEEVGPIRADRRQLEQVLVNLVVNARDAMPDGGTIRIETASRDLTAAEPRGRAVLPPGRYALIRVADRGCGIPPELADKIFEPFVTTKRPGEGTGLGLSTVYGIVKQSGGFIFVDDRDGGGTVFTLYFPVHDALDEAEVLEPLRPQPAAAIARGQEVVLLVEDEAAVRAFAARALQLRGYTVIEADSGEVALDLLADPGLRVDVVVSDVIMAGLDGPSWVRQALGERPLLRVVFASGYADDTFAAALADIPQARFLPKPYSLDDLTGIVREALDTD